MTPPEHFVYGLTAANAVYAGASIRSSIRNSYLLCLMVAGVMSVFPDIDSFFGAYGSQNPWIGHRGWTHSILAVLLESVLLVLALKFLARILKIQTDRLYLRVLFLSAFFGGISHILCDMVTPPSVWGGLPVLFPGTMRVGGWSYIGWYFISLFWIVLVLFFLGFLISVFGLYLQHKNLTNKFSAAWFFSFSISLLATGYSCYRILNSQYRDDANWYADQKKEIQAFPDPIPAWTNRSMEIFLRLFHRARS